MTGCALAAGAFCSHRLLHSSSFFSSMAPKASGETYDVGTAAAGDNIEHGSTVPTFGVGAVSVTNLSINGASFGFSAQPSLPYVLAPGTFV